MKLPHDHDEHEPTDHASRAMCDRLDALGRSDADHAPQDLGARLLDAVSGVYAPTPIAIEPARAAWWRGSSVRAAAAIALVGAVAAMFYAWPGPKPPSGGVSGVAMAEDRIEGLLAVLGERDGFEDQIASIELWADAIGSDSAGMWIGSDLGEAGFNGGAF